MVTSAINRASGYSFNNLMLTASKAMPATWESTMKPKGINRGAVADSVIKVIRVPSFSTTRRVIFLRLSITALHSLWASSLRNLDSERRKRQHLINQVPWYGRRESKHIRSAYNDRSRVQRPMFGERQNALLSLSKPPQRRQSGAVAHDFVSLHRKQKAPEVSEVTPKDWTGY